MYTYVTPPRIEWKITSIYGVFLYSAESHMLKYIFKPISDYAYTNVNWRSMGKNRNSKGGANFEKTTKARIFLGFRAK